ncbi:uncharacterized protein LOC129609192 [Condylostylus longicornis]|uniref:uncharacterized protein LOC129609192 n=1 Tax=Condylostylus longicornis TaxID=2530218 RepID=UPI00244E48E4|nr:uncharacterized protein LOC129609192 [Condylostylus longicornis]
MILKSNVLKLFLGNSRLWAKKDLGICEIVELGNVSPERSIPNHIHKPDYYYEFMEPGCTLGTPEIKSRKEIYSMRESCKLAARILKSCTEILKVGITTDEIDAYVHEKVISNGAYPSPLRYAGFPKSICTSVNNVACHGIPDDRKLCNGDIINIDITVFYNGFHGDCSKTFLVGDVDERGKFLVKSTKECLYGAINICAPGVSYNKIGKYIQRFADSRNLKSIPAFIGHGIGSYFHGPPEILHYDNDIEGVMLPGVTFTIEPILSLGSAEVELQEDGWTAMSTDLSRSAQFEHTVLITQDGVEILTVSD